MRAVKYMLLGIAFLLFAILLHLYILGGLVTDFLAVPGLFLVAIGFISNRERD
jgi:uncharacterized membrane protein YqgA involved in biofilm formation